MLTEQVDSPGPSLSNGPVSSLRDDDSASEDPRGASEVRFLFICIVYPFHMLTRQSDPSSSSEVSEDSSSEEEGDDAADVDPRGSSVVSLPFISTAYVSLC